MQAIFNTFLYDPFINLLALLYEYVTFHSLGLSIIVLTVLIRFILYPIFFKTAKHQKVIQALQPKVKQLQETHKDDKMKQTEAMMALYKEHGVNPMTPFFLLLVQLPILIALYTVFKDGFSAEALNHLYPFVPRPESVSNLFMGMDLTLPSLYITVGSAILQYVQAKLSLIKPAKGSENDPAVKVAKNMVFISPILTLVILYNLPAAIGLYWLTGVVFSIFQQIIINKHVEGEYTELTGDKVKKLS